MSNKDVFASQLPTVDWNRHTVGFGPRIKDQQQQELLGGIAFSRDAMKVVRLCLTRELGGEVPAEVFDEIKTFVQVLAAMEQWSVERGMP